MCYNETHRYSSLDTYLLVVVSVQQMRPIGRMDVALLKIPSPAPCVQGTASQRPLWNWWMCLRSLSPGPWRGLAFCVEDRGMRTFSRGRKLLLLCIRSWSRGTAGIFWGRVLRSCFRSSRRRASW